MYCWFSGEERIMEWMMPPAHFASLIAQLVERETVNLEVVGSIPTWRATFWVGRDTVSLEDVTPIPLERYFLHLRAFLGRRLVE